MGDYSKSVMVALLPKTTYWSTLKLPHCTVVYPGDKDQYNDDQKDSLILLTEKVSKEFSDIVLNVLAPAVFGPEGEKVDVLPLALTDDLFEIRRRFETWSVSQYHEYKPHATVGPEGSLGKVIPTQLTFDRICVSWGDELHAFPFQ